MSWWRRLFDHSGPRDTGYPPSSNGASSMHLVWSLASAEPIVEVAATIEVVVPPAVNRLYFWALQASFEGGGAGHLGLQWGADPRQPGPAHANWGGYTSGGAELTGSPSPLPSSTANPNTRDYPWRPASPYRLRIARGTGGWAGEITDLATGSATVIRELDGPGASLAAPVVWAEVFARCDDPAVTVRWSDLAGVTASGAVVRPESVRTSYQARADGGCDNTSVAPDGAGLAMSTATRRATPPGTDLPLP